MKFKILTTGGTIDKVFSTELEQLEFKTPIANQTKFSVHKDVSIQNLMSKDSKVITSLDRELILKTCMETLESKILITHGTDTLVNTAKFLNAQLIPKTIVITGAFIPASFIDTDAISNLNYAFGCLEHLNNGVWICIHGDTFIPDNCSKNFNKSIFEKADQIENKT